ncbi:MAG: hypothetical protein M1536_09175 [Firmicutes bacterium]|nr:hypothetical protein [Bacillota bacterium]
MADSKRQEAAGIIKDFLEKRKPFSSLFSWAEKASKYYSGRFEDEAVNFASQVLLKYSPFKTKTEEDFISGEEEELKRYLEILLEGLEGKRPIFRLLRLKRDLTFHPGEIEKEVLKILKEFLGKGTVRGRIEIESLLEGIDYNYPESLLCQEAIIKLGKVLPSSKVETGKLYSVKTEAGAEENFDESHEDLNLYYLEQIAACLEGLAPYEVLLAIHGEKVFATLSLVGRHIEDKEIYSRIKERYR